MQELQILKKGPRKRLTVRLAHLHFSFLQGFAFLQFWFIPEKNCNAVKRCSFRAKLFFGFFCSPKARLKENSRSGLDHLGAVIFLCLDHAGTLASGLDQWYILLLFVYQKSSVCCTGRGSVFLLILLGVLRLFFL